MCANTSSMTQFPLTSLHYKRGHSNLKHYCISWYMGFYSGSTTMEYFLGVWMHMIHKRYYVIYTID